MSAELEEQRDFLLRSIDDLEQERLAGDISDDDYRALKDDYTARAAAVLRVMDDDLASNASDPGPRGRGRSMAVVGGVLLFSVLAGGLVARTAGERHPGQTSSGSIAATGPSEQLARARQLIGQNKVLDAIKTYDALLRVDPKQPEALTYRGWLLRLAGRGGGDQSLIDKGLESINRAIAADPTYPEAHVFKGIILFQDKADPKAAIPELRAFLAANPPKDMLPLVEDVLRQALAAAGQPTA